MSYGESPIVDEILKVPQGELCAAKLGVSMRPPSGTNLRNGDPRVYKHANAVLRVIKELNQGMHPIIDLDQSSEFE